MTEQTTSWPAICAVKNASPVGSSEYVNFTSVSLGLTLVHSSFTIFSLGLTDVQLVGERAGRRPQLFVNRSVKFLRLLA